VAEDNGKKVAAGLIAAGTAISRARSQAIRNAALKAKNVQLDELDKVSRTRSLRNVGKKGAKLGVRYDIKGTKNPTVLVTANGPWQLIEGDTKAHRIPREGRKRKAKVLAFPNDAFAKHVMHPGTKGRRPFAKGRKRAHPIIVKELGKTVTTAVRQALKF